MALGSSVVAMGCLTVLATHSVMTVRNILRRDRRREMQVRSFVEVTRSVQIEISNMTKDITLENPRSYFPHADCPRPPDPVVPPGSSTTVRFTSRSYWDCKGVLVYESNAFTLAIYFSNTLLAALWPRELGLEVSLSKSHLGKLQDVYKHMMGWNISSSVGDTAFHHIKLDDTQETARASIGPVQVLATMSDSRSSIINVVVRENPQTAREEKSFLQGGTDRRGQYLEELQNYILGTPGSSETPIEEGRPHR